MYSLTSHNQQKISVYLFKELFILHCSITTKHQPPTKLEMHSEELPDYGNLPMYVRLPL